MGIVWLVEVAARRRGVAHPWVYGWAASCVFLSPSIAFVCLKGGWGLAWSLSLAVVVGATAYPVLRNLIEIMRTHPKRRLYVDEGYDDPPLDAPLYQATDFAGSSEPIRAERPTQKPAPPPSVFRWQDANIPESRRAAVLTGVGVCLALGGVTFLMQPSWRNLEARDVAAALEEAGYPAARVQPAEHGNNCAAGRAKPYRWSAPGAQGGACRSPSGRVSFWVDRTWSRSDAQ
jgi:hypothetical protein